MHGPDARPPTPGPAARHRFSPPTAPVDQLVNGALAVTTPAQLPVRLLIGPENFVRAAEAYRPGDPLPLLDGPLVRRDLRRLASAPVWQPLVPARHVVGLVRDDPFAPLGRLLAMATCRPWRWVSLTLLPVVREGTLTVVAAPEALTPAVMAGVDGAVGFFTARDLQSGCALLVRTLLEQTSAESMCLDPLLPYMDTDGRVQGPAVSLDRLGPVSPDGRYLALAVRAHGRECMVRVGPHVLCGRADTVPLRLGPLPAGGGVAACQHTNECLLRDVDRRGGLHRPRARDLAASVLFLDGCRSVAVNGRIGTDVTLALSALDGTATAVVGCVGVRQGPATTTSIFVGLLGAGMPVGQVVRVLNDVGRGAGYGELTVIGDSARDWWDSTQLATVTLTRDAAELRLAGATAVEVRAAPDVIRLVVTAADGTTMVSVPTEAGNWLLVHPAGQPLNGEFRVHQSTVNVPEQLGAVVHPALDAFGRWPEQGLPAVTEGIVQLRSRAHALAVETTSPQSTGTALDAALDALLADVLAIQRDLVDDWLLRVDHGSDRYADRWAEPVRFGPEKPTTCPQCGQPASRVPAVAACNEALRLFQLLCGYCGEAAAGVDHMPWTASLQAASTVRRGDEIKVEGLLTGLAGPAVVSLGAAVQYGRALDTKLHVRSHRFIPDRADVRISGTMQIGRRAVADSQTIRMVVVVNGDPVVLSHTVWVEPWPAGGAVRERVRHG